jgi:hypothetical protein
MIGEGEAEFGMRIGRGSKNTRRKLALVTIC